MLFRSAALFTASVAAASATSVEVPMNDVSMNSKLGGKIMSKARRLDANNNQEAGAWVANYSLVFQKCAVSDEYFAFEGGNQDRNNWQGAKQRLVHFKLCPSSNCNSCNNGADYVVPMQDFVQMYFQAKMEAEEYNCEMVRENCYCENANDDEACEQQCYAAAGLSNCGDQQQQNNGNYQGAYDFDLERAGECERMEVEEETLYYYLQENGGSSYNVYGNGGEMGLFVGAQCSANGKSIYLNTFMDEWCSIEAPKGAFAKFNYGRSLPYSDTSLIENNCISCKEPQNYNEQNNGDQNDADNILEICERLYEQSAKCEQKLPSGTTYYPNTYGCNLVKSLKAPGRGKGSGSAAKVFASLFAICAIAFAGVAYYFHEKSQRSNVALVEEPAGEGAMA